MQRHLGDLARAHLGFLIIPAQRSVLLANWLAPGRRRHAAESPGPFRGSPGPSRGMVFSHFGLAIGGLGAWIGYLLTRWAPVAWIALAILLPVAGLGMATLIQAIPDPDPAPGGDPVRDPPALPSVAVRTRKMPVVMIAAHGALATATLLLALLGSVAALGSR